MRERERGREGETGEGETGEGERGRSEGMREGGGRSLGRLDAAAINESMPYMYVHIRIVVFTLYLKVPNLGSNCSLTCIYGNATSTHACMTPMGPAARTRRS